MRKFLMVAVGAVLAGPAAAQAPGSAARQPGQQALPGPHHPVQSQAAQTEAERERAAHAQGISNEELYRRRESGLDEGQPLRR